MQPRAGCSGSRWATPPIYPSTGTAGCCSRQNCGSSPSLGATECSSDRGIASSCGMRRAGTSGAMPGSQASKPRPICPPSSSPCRCRGFNEEGRGPWQEHSGRRGRAASNVVEHTPVLAAEALAGLALEAGGYYVDATFGRGGHTALILKALGPEGRVLALDRDPQAIEAGRKQFAHEVRLTLIHASFADLAALVPAHAQQHSCRGVLFDLGVSSPQLDDPRRGFSFRAEGPLDMRMDPTRGQPVSSWLARASVDEIRQVIATFGEERFARRVAQAIVARRSKSPLEDTADLAALVAGAVRTREPGKHPATRT